MRRLIFSCALAALAFACPRGIAAEQTTGSDEEPEGPRLELGLGVGALSNPDYRGSTRESITVLPVPYVSYQDKRVQLSRDGLVARLFDTGNFRLRLSANATLPNDDNDKGPRRGMPELLPTFEIGPSFDWRLSEAGGKWDLRVPVRVVAAADLNEFEGIGWLTYPHLRFSRAGMSVGGWELEAATGAGPLWASRQYHQYFYRVEPRYATADRPAYDVGSGYSGARVTGYVGLRRGPWRIGLGVTHDELAGSEMRDSPLMETEHSTVIAVGVFYSMWVWEGAKDKPAEPAVAPAQARVN